MARIGLWILLIFSTHNCSLDDELSTKKYRGFTYFQVGSRPFGYFLFMKVNLLPPPENLR